MKYTGIETALSNYHKTIHLTINEGPVGWNLIWTSYEGFTFSTYYIYRGSAMNSLELLDSISSSFTSYTDINPPLGPLYYAIEIINEDGCFPDRDNDYSRSRSNVQFNGVTGLEDIDESIINIFPNPARNILNIQLNENMGETLIFITDTQGKTMLSEQLHHGSNEVSIDALSPGVYILQIEYAQNKLIRKLIVQ
jgi:hypothetical protein